MKISMRNNLIKSSTSSVEPLYGRRCDVVYLEPAWVLLRLAVSGGGGGVGCWVAVVRRRGVPCLLGHGGSVSVSVNWCHKIVRRVSHAWKDTETCVDSWSEAEGSCGTNSSWVVLHGFVFGFSQRKSAKISVGRTGINLRGETIDFRSEKLGFWLQRRYTGRSYVHTTRSNRSVGGDTSSSNTSNEFCLFG